MGSASLVSFRENLKPFGYSSAPKLDVIHARLRIRRV